jgi:hypothetical protein
MNPPAQIIVARSGWPRPFVEGDRAFTYFAKPAQAEINLVTAAHAPKVSACAAGRRCQQHPEQRHGHNRAGPAQRQATHPQDISSPLRVN